MTYGQGGEAVPGGEMAWRKSKIPRRWRLNCHVIPKHRPFGKRIRRNSDANPNLEAGSSKLEARTSLLIELFHVPEAVSCDVASDEDRAVVGHVHEDGSG